MHKIFLLIAFLFSLISCNQKRNFPKDRIEKLITTLNNKTLTRLKTKESDTANIMRTIIDSEFIKLYLPSITTLIKDNQFGDSIIFKQGITYQEDINISEFFPKDLKVKFMTEAEMLILAKKIYTDSSHIPNFLEIIYFKKAEPSDNIKVPAYVITVRNSSINLDLDKNGLILLEKMKLKTNKIIDKRDCKFSPVYVNSVGVKFLIRPDSITSILERGDL
jgi:hypothetical protein